MHENSLIFKKRRWEAVAKLLLCALEHVHVKLEWLRKDLVVLSEPYT